MLNYNHIFCKNKRNSEENCFDEKDNCTGTNNGYYCPF